MITNTNCLRFFHVCVLAACFSGSFSLNAASVSGVVLNNNGRAVKDAVLSLMPIGAFKSQMPGETQTAVMVQKDKQFIPYVLPVRTGTTVSFPNKDNLLHHVYSFAKTKGFEIKLYAGTPVNPLVFDQPGVVPLGCNIHDWMLAYIYVTDAPYFATSDEAGKVNIDVVATGQYRAQIWHPRLKGKTDAHFQIVTLIEGETKQLEFNLLLKRDRRREPPDDYYGSDY